MRKMLGHLFALTPILFVLAAAACNKNPTTPSGSNPSPPAAGSAIVYAAVGASDAVGVGASVPCLNPFGDCPDGTGYVPVIARQLKASGFTLTLNNFGIPGAVIAADFQAIAVANGDSTVFTLTDAEMPFVPRTATVVTVFAGPNDVRTVARAIYERGAGGANPAAYIDSQVQAFAADYRTLLNGIRSRAPGAWVVVANLPNFAGLPYTAGYTAEQKRYIQQISVGMSKVVNGLAGQGLPVVDLLCDARSYLGATYSSDGFHPNDTGYAYIASKYVEAIRSAGYPAPAGSCAQMTLVNP